MPQLSPLNWIFLFILFWFTIFLMFTLIWWHKTLSYKTLAATKNIKSIENKWNW